MKMRLKKNWLKRGKRFLALFLSCGVIAAAMPEMSLPIRAAEGHAHPVCGAECDGHGEELNHAPVTFKPVSSNGEKKLCIDGEEQSGYVLPAGQYFLEDDVTLAETLVIGGAVDLCLNGHALRYGGTEGGVVRIEETGTLNLCDCQPDADGPDGCKGGQITGGNFKSYADGHICGGGGVTDCGNFNMYGGTIRGNNVNFYMLRNGGGVFVKNGIFTLYRGTIAANTQQQRREEYSEENYAFSGNEVYLTGSAAFYMKDGVITGKAFSSRAGTGVFLDGEESLFTMTGGEIVKNEDGVALQQGSFAMKGGKISDNSGMGISTINELNDLKIEGGEISKNRDGVLALGEDTPVAISSNAVITKNTRIGVSAMMGAFVTMSGGKIMDNKGTGVLLRNAGLKMSGGEITGNSGKKDSSLYWEAGGVDVSSQDNMVVSYGYGRFIMTGGKISGNTTQGRGGGIFLHGQGKAYFSGEAQVFDNTAGDEGNKIDNNVYLPEGYTLNLDGSLTGDARIGVTTEEKPAEGENVVIAEGDGYTIQESDEDYFFSDENYWVTRKEEAIALGLIPDVRITRQPENRTVTYGSIDGSLMVEAVISGSDSEPVYQWYQSTDEGDVPLADEDGAELVIPRDLSVGSYSYYCEVTNPDTGAHAKSETAIVTVQSPTEPPAVSPTPPAESQEPVASPTPPAASQEPVASPTPPAASQEPVTSPTPPAASQKPTVSPTPPAESQSPTVPPTPPAPSMPTKSAIPSPTAMPTKSAMPTASAMPSQNPEKEEIADVLGVPDDTAEKIQAIAVDLAIPHETILVNNEYIVEQETDDDIYGAYFAMIRARESKTGKKKIKLKWNRVKGADGYMVYGNKCGNENRYKLIKTIKNGKTKSFTQKKRKKGVFYKYVVRAYKLVDGYKVTIALSKTIHITADGGRWGNAKSVKVNKKTVQLKKGKKKKIRAREIKRKKPVVKPKHREIKYESDRPSVAKVNGKGVIKAKRKGSCSVYFFAQNGVYKKVKVKVV